jgi:hypothetical protein
MMWPQELVLAIVDAEPVERYVLRLHFDDGSIREIDFEPFLTRSVHPQIRQFLVPERFRSFRLEDGDLVWGDYELCFPIADLYTGNL